jgi:uncharacterized membrane protein YidH (DUF202 family)
MNSKTLIIINICLLAVTIVGISGSSYGLGINQGNQSSAQYQSASIFLTISIFLCVFSIISLIALVLFSAVPMQNGVRSFVGNMPTASPMFPPPTYLTK